MEYFKMALQKYAQFTGRSRRSEYWYFVLFYIITAVVAIILDNLLGIAFLEFYGPLYLIVVLGLVIPSLAVVVRRLHDVGKSGWFYFIGLIPIIGAIWLLVLMVTDSQPGMNKWGPNPKGIGNQPYGEA